MTRPFRRFAVALAIAFASAAAPAALAEALTPEQREAVRAEVRQLLRDQPELVLDALQTLQQREQAAQADKQKAALQTLRDDLIADPATPVLGNPEGDVTLVEFFDYQCGYCKRVFPAIQAVMEADSGLRLAMKEFPILGEASQFAARASLAAEKQGRYAAFHTALMKIKGGLSEDAVLKTAKAVGLDVERLREDMRDDSIDEALRRNFALARALGIQGTPAFVVGDRLVPGALDRATLEDLIAEARAGSAE